MNQAIMNKKVAHIVGLTVLKSAFNTDYFTSEIFDEVWYNGPIEGYNPCSYWGLGGPIIEKYKMQVKPLGDNWRATFPSVNGDVFCNDRTPLLAAMGALIGAYERGGINYAS